MRTNDLPFANDTVTLYNRAETEDSDGRKSASWFRRVLSGCRYGETAKSSSVSGAVKRSWEANIDVPADSDYAAPAIWAALVDRRGKFTLAPGDIIIKGEIAQEIAGEMTPKALIAKYRANGAVTVVSVNDRTSGPLAHYAVRGE